jgi:hypothetical protein
LARAAAPGVCGGAGLGDAAGVALPDSKERSTISATRFARFLHTRHRLQALRSAGGKAAAAPKGVAAHGRQRRQRPNADARKTQPGRLRRIACRRRSRPK